MAAAILGNFSMHYGDLDVYVVTRYALIPGYIRKDNDILSEKGWLVTFVLVEFRFSIGRLTPEIRSEDS